MSAPRRFDRLLRPYPARWRERYGQELAALLEDTYGDAPVPLRQRASLLRGALVEHLHASGLQSGAGRAVRVRAGALLVLCAWAGFMVAGSAFAKYLEHWDAAVAPAARRVPADAVTAVTWVAELAVVMVALGALALAAPVARSVRDRGWGAFGRSLRTAGAFAAGALVVTAGVVLFAHSHTPSARNGGSWTYAAVGAVWGAVLLVALVAVTRAAVAAARRVELRGVLLRFEAVLALGVFACMTVVLGGTAVWWAVMARHTPRFLDTSLGPVGTWGSVAPPVMVGVTAAMLVALSVGAAGAWSIVGALRSAD